MRRVNVDRMRRHQRRDSGRPRLTKDEKVRHLQRISGDGFAGMLERVRDPYTPRADLSWVRGPYPAHPAETVALLPDQEVALAEFQARSGLVVDKRLGPQSWAALDAHNTDAVRRESDKWRNRWMSADRAWAKDRAALRSIVNVLDPICECAPGEEGCGLRDEAGEALRLAREALGEMTWLT